MSSFRSTRYLKYFQIWYKDHTFGIQPKKSTSIISNSAYNVFSSAKEATVPVGLFVFLFFSISPSPRLPSSGTRKARTSRNQHLKGSFTSRQRICETLPNTSSLMLRPFAVQHQFSAKTLTTSFCNMCFQLPHAPLQTFIYTCREPFHLYNNELRGKKAGKW